jgi:outer membrane protein assembly factor BamB
MEIAEMVFVAFNKNIVALDQTTGSTLWTWKMPHGSQYPTLLVQNERLFVCAMGYTFCLDPITGTLLWENDLPGMGVGVASIATLHSTSSSTRAAAAAAQEQHQQSVIMVPS